MAKLGFWNTARARPDAVAVIGDDGARHRAGDLLARCNQQARALADLGALPGDAVALIMGNRVELLELTIATIQMGLYVVPVPTSLAPPEIAHILSDSGAKVVIAERETAERAHAALAILAAEAPSLLLPPLFAVDPCDNDTPPGWSARWRDQPADDVRGPHAGDKLVYTSGTSGVPKAVKRPLGGLSLDQVGKLAAIHLNAVAGIRPRSGAVHLVCSPLYHSASLLWCTDQLHLGHTASLMKRWTAEGMLARIERDRVTAALVVPTHFHRLLALPADVRAAHDLSSLRHVVHTGAACSVAVKRRMLAWWGPVVYEVYGATEGAGTRVTPQEWLARPGTVGKTFGRIRIIGDDGSERAAGEVGTVYIKLGARAFAYQGDDAKTASTRIAGHFTVGDLGYIDADGYLFLVGRSSDVIISGGVNLYPAEIEAALASHPAVADVGVVGVPSDEWGEEVKAVVELVPGRELDGNLVSELQAHCRERLSAVKCPRSFDAVAALPRNEAGKLSRRDLRDRYR